ncbi:MAG TPA: TatD family hydrolase [Prolixibacteraceae bacterium]
MFVDTHSHIYSEQFSTDRNEVIDRAVKASVSKIILPNIDSSTIKSMLDLADSKPQLFIPLIGLHPTSVKEDFRKELEIMEYWMNKRKFTGIGEIGIDLYWDKTFLNEQIEAFRIQIGWAKKMRIPIAIHVRDSFEEVFEVMEQEKEESLTGVFHSFTGNAEQALQAIDLGFKIGIGGIVTFKNSGLDAVVQHIGLQHILLETDSPWLAPAPHRGRRNESAFVSLVAAKIALLHETSIEEVGRITTQNAQQLFGF